MIDVIGLGFDENDGSIFFSSSFTPGEKLKMFVEDGVNVSLKKGDISVEVKNISKQSDYIYKGVVNYVEPYKSLEKVGIDEDVEILFRYKHIFACDRP